METTLSQWRENLKQALKDGINENNAHLLQCPSQVLLDLAQEKTEQPHPFRVWEQSCLIEFKGVKYLKLLKTSGKRGPTEKPLAILRSYNDCSNRRSKKLEENCLTLLLERPSQHNLIAKRGNVVGKFLGRPSIQSDQEPPPIATLRGGQQEFLTPLGKRGIVAFHTGHQYCSLSQPLHGEFQRFFLGPHPHSAVIRAAHTLGRLAEAEPKSIAETSQKLLKRFNDNLKRLGEEILYRLEHTIYDYSLEMHACQARSFGGHLPTTTLSKGPHRLLLSLCADKTQPYTFQRCAVSLRTDNPNTDSNFNKEGFLEIWKSLQKK